MKNLLIVAGLALLAWWLFGKKHHRKHQMVARSMPRLTGSTARGSSEDCRRCA